MTTPDPEDFDPEAQDRFFWYVMYMIIAWFGTLFFVFITYLVFLNSQTRPNAARNQLPDELRRYGFFVDLFRPQLPVRRRRTNLNTSSSSSSSSSSTSGLSRGERIAAKKAEKRRLKSERKQFQNLLADERKERDRQKEEINLEKQEEQDEREKLKEEARIAEQN